MKKKPIPKLPDYLFELVGDDLRPVLPRVNRVADAKRYFTVDQATKRFGRDETHWRDERLSFYKLDADPVDAPPPPIRNQDDDQTYADPDAWKQLKSLFADDPMLHPLLVTLESFAGGSPVRLWLAAALYSFERAEEAARQQDIIDLICKAAGQPCKLAY